MNIQNKIALFVASLFLAGPARAALVDFEDVPLNPSGIYNGYDSAGSFTSRGVRFSNTYTPAFASWSGFAASRHTDNTTPGFTNQYSAIPGAGADGSSNYAVAYVTSFDPAPAITLPEGQSPQSVLITNTTYAYLAMLNGDGPARKFGGTSGTEPDYLKLTITGQDASNQPVGSVDFFLADYRSASSAQDYLVNAWTPVDLSSLARARTLTFALETTDNHPTFGANTPTYFALDNLVTVPEPGVIALASMCALTLLNRRQRTQG